MKSLMCAIVFAIALLIPTTGWSQTANPAATLAFDQNAVSAAEATSFIYRYYPDGTPLGIGIVLAVVTCSGATSPFLCLTPFPAFTPGAHTLAITAANVGGESLKSTVLAFTFVVIPSPPTNLRIQ